jgi:HEAT repeat protein
MYLRPKIPPEVIPVLREFTRIPDPRTQARAIYGIARSFTPGSDDQKLLEALLSSPETQTRSSAAQGVGMARVQDSAIIEKLRQLLGHTDRGVVREAIRAIDSIGPAANFATADLQKILDSTTDQELSQAAAGAIRRINAPPVR